MFPLQEIPDEILLKVLEKTEKIHILRRTCNFLDEFIEEHRLRLSTRRYAEKDFEIFIQQKSLIINGEYLIGVSSVSAISFRNVNLKFHHECPNRQIRKRLLHTLRKLSMITRNLNFSGFSNFSFIDQCASLVTHRSIHIHNENRISLESLLNSKAIKNTRSFSVKGDVKDDDYSKILNRMKHLKRLSVNCLTNPLNGSPDCTKLFLRFIHELSLAEDTGNMKKITFVWKNTVDIASLCPQLQLIFRQTISSERNAHLMPLTIFAFKLPKKIVIVSNLEVYANTLSMQEVQIRLIGNSAKRMGIFLEKITGEAPGGKELKHIYNCIPSTTTNSSLTAKSPSTGSWKIHPKRVFLKWYRTFSSAVFAGSH